MSRRKIQRKLDVIKANRKGSRDAELENSTGWKSVKKAHKTKKLYNRTKLANIERIKQMEKSW